MVEKHYGQATMSSWCHLLSNLVKWQAHDYNHSVNLNLTVDKVFLMDFLESWALIDNKKLGESNLE